MFVLNVLVAAIITAAKSCETPNGQRGDCKPINLCSYIRFQERGGTNDYLRKSVCGFVGTYPKICCPLGSAIPPRVKSIATSELLPNSTICGLSEDLDKYPWWASLEYKNRTGKIYFGCSGVLISRRYVLTVRHCLTSTLYRVRLGENIAEVEEKVINVGGDVGLIRLGNEVNYSDFVRPICLPLTTDYPDKPHIGQKLKIRSEINFNVPVRSGQVVVKPLSDCEPVEVPSDEELICVGGDSPVSDNGGFLMGMVLDEDKIPHWYAYGIVSFRINNPHRQAGKPSLHTKVVNFVKWIVANLKP